MYSRQSFFKQIQHTAPPLSPREDKIEDVYRIFRRKLREEEKQVQLQVIMHIMHLCMRKIKSVGLTIAMTLLTLKGLMTMLPAFFCITGITTISMFRFR